MGHHKCRKCTKVEEPAPAPPPPPPPAPPSSSSSSSSSSKSDCSRCPHTYPASHPLKKFNGVLSSTAQTFDAWFRDNAGYVVIAGGMVAVGMIVLSYIENVPMLPETLQIIGLASIAYHTREQLVG
uniref:Uncharacterized protein n=1 Tax=Compsopogon caeruleus TaxID=31354 RepID=A0A7S1TFA6_9RHOD|mmetsp:Transcript_3982/g.7682  ORF Transcript_3982/g.7682 Transcript_3982/m.7682 type:complete len:126 (+) Transcript_3982:173-550(+)